MCPSAPTCFLSAGSSWASVCPYLCSCAVKCVCVCVTWGEVRWGEVRGISSSSQTSFRDSDERRRKEILLVGPPEPSKNQMFKSTVCVESAYLITTSSFSFLPLRRKDNQISVENCNRVRNQDQQGSPSEVYKSIYTFLQHEDKSQQRINLIVYVFHADIVSYESQKRLEKSCPSVLCWYFIKKPRDYTARGWIPTTFYIWSIKSSQEHFYISNMDWCTKTLYHKMWHKSQMNHIKEWIIGE